MQTNIKLVEFGNSLILKVKKIRLEGEHLTPKQMQSVCKKLPIAATPYYEGSNQYVLIEYRSNLTKFEVKIGEWIIKLIPTDENLELFCSNTEDRNSIGEIYKRSFLQQIEATKQFWTLDSPRIFYENVPFYHDDLYCVYRRFSVSDVDMGYNGLGFAVDISTAVFTKSDISKIPAEDLKRLLRRQKEQKGTLLYRGYNKNSKCYYAKFDGKTTLGTAPSVNILGERFSSPFEYYREKQPRFNVLEQDKAVLVSFKNLEYKVYVPANKVFLRLMNDTLPNEIAKIDKINPNERRDYLDNHFWALLGDKPFGGNLARIKKDYYKPNPNVSGVIPLPNIIFKNNKTLFTPNQQNKNEYKNHYRNRREFLEKHQCFDVFGGNDGSNVFFIVPENLNENIIEAYEKSIIDKIHQLTGQSLDPIRIKYSNYMSGVWELKNNYDNGFVLFLFQEDINEPTVYYTIEQELGEEWNLKRATVKELNKNYQKWQKSNFYLKDRNWNSYIEMTTLSIIQRMNCTPFVVEAKKFNYDMHLVIDVSEEGSHFALSGQIWNKNMTKPIFPSYANRKFGKKRESINAQILEDDLYKFLSQKSDEIKRYKIERLLILRDGKFCEDENIAIENAFARLKADELLSNNFMFDFVEYHKTTRKEIRIWENEDNVLEGSYFFINPTMVALATTGAGTLNQGTSNPIILISRFSSNPNMKNILEDVFLGSQFNFSNPKVAQRETLTIVKADSLLQEKREQEIKRIR